MDITKIVTQPDDTYFDNNFIPIVEDHLSYLKTSGNYQTITVTDQEGYKYEGDFYGLLTYKGINKNFHYAALRMNGYTCSAEYDGTPGTFLTPLDSVINLLRKIYETTA